MKEGELVNQKLRLEPQTRIGKNGLADDLKLSRFQLYRRVKSHSGLSPKQLAGKHRIDQACILLQQTKQSVAAIGTEVGVDDPNYFTRFFKLHTGMSPREWRRQHAKSATPHKPAPASAATHTKSKPVTAKVEDDLPVHLL